MSDLASPGAARSDLARLEAEAVLLLEREWEAFARDVFSMATQALDGSVLLAAANPFAYTNVIARWRAGVKRLSELRGDIFTHDVTLVLLESDLPFHLHEATREMLLEAQAEGWSQIKTRRRLSMMLTPSPRPRPGDPTYPDFKAQVRALGRTTATRNFNIKRLDELVMGGFRHKKWVAHHDERVRASHANVDGTVVPLAGAFVVGGSMLSFPGDPAGPYHETVNCRCVIVGARPS